MVKHFVICPQEQELKSILSSLLNYVAFRFPGLSVCYVSLVLIDLCCFVVLESYLIPLLLLFPHLVVVSSQKIY